MNHYIAVLSIVALSACTSEKEPTPKELSHAEKVTVYNEISRRSWMQALEFTYSELKHNKSPHVDFVVKRMLQCCINDTAIEYGDGNIDTRLQWDKLKALRKSGMLSDERLADPLSLNEYYEKNPDGFPSLRNLSEKVVGNEKIYRKYCAWFSEELSK